MEEPKAKKSGDFSRFIKTPKTYLPEIEEKPRTKPVVVIKKDQPKKAVKPKEEVLPSPEAEVPSSPDIMRLNKYLSTSGVTSRRKAAEIVKEGLVTVNGKVEVNPAYEMQPTDVVEFEGKVVKPTEKLVYFIINKPKNIITTASDEKGRRTVIDLLGNKVRERVFPVGRLDRNTTGLLLLTNDGDLATKLTHPSYRVSKVYTAFLDKELSMQDLEKIREGLTLEDGFVKVDGINFIQGSSKKEVGLEIHVGKNRIVRRIFEHLGYEVEKLDRLQFANLTKKDLPRGFFRPLTEKEVIMLKHFTNQKPKSNP